MNVQPRRWRWQCLALIVLATLAYPAQAQDESLSPGINKNYENPKVERIVEQYERENRDVVQHSKEIVAACELRPGVDVADIGAGTGLHTRPIARKVAPDGKVYAVEITKPFLEQIEKTCRDQGIENVVCVPSKVGSTELDPDSIDLAFLCDTYHHFEYPQAILASLHRALRPGGRLVVVDFEKIEGTSQKWILEHVRAGRQGVSAEIVKAGFAMDRQMHVDGMIENYMLQFRRP